MQPLGEHWLAHSAGLGEICFSRIWARQQRSFQMWDPQHALPLLPPRGSSSGQDLDPSTPEIWGQLTLHRCLCRVFGVFCAYSSPDGYSSTTPRGNSVSRLTNVPWKAKSPPLENYWSGPAKAARHGSPGPPWPTTHCSQPLLLAHRE